MYCLSASPHSFKPRKRLTQTLIIVQNESPAAVPQWFFKARVRSPSWGTKWQHSGPTTFVQWSSQSCCIPATTAMYSGRQKRRVQPDGISKLCHAHNHDTTLQEWNLLSAGHLEPKAEFLRDCRLPGNVWEVCSYQQGGEYKSTCTPRTWQGVRPMSHYLHAVKPTHTFLLCAPASSLPKTEWAT